MSRSIGRIAALALVWIMFVRMLNAATLLSPVVDEQSHISRGVSVWRTGDLRLQIGHPIGLNLWQTFPLALDPTLHLPLDHESWANAAWDRFGDQFLWRVNANPDGVVFRSRVMEMLLALVLGALVFRWASELYGATAGVLALALYSLDPNVLAHGMLATTDLGVTLFMFAATYALWHATRTHGRRWFSAAGALSALALVSKYSALFLIPIFLALLLAWARAGRIRLTIVMRHSSFVIAPALFVILAAYLLRIDLYVREFGFLLANTQTHPSFLLGQQSIEGWWYYFIVTFLLKTPIPTLLLLSAAVIMQIRAGRLPRVEPSGRSGSALKPAEASTPGLTTIFLLVPPILYFFFSVISSFNVGYRHLLPALPFLLVYASGITATRPPSFVVRRLSFGIVSALMVWLGLSSFAAHPDYIAYFNEAAPLPHYNVLIDSNLDWGQSLKELRSYIEVNRVESVELSYFGTADPAAYGIRYDPLPRWPPPKRTGFVPANPAPGVYAISASNLQGVLLDDPSTFSWFKHRDPDAIVGQSILVYHVAADPNPPQAVGLCREPWTPIDDDKVDALFGRTGLRVVRFDCANAGWWSDGPAWYVLPSPARFGSERATFDFGRVEYVRSRRDGSVIYSVSRRETGASLPSTPLDAPARFDGGLTLLGVDGLRDQKAGRVFSLISVWRVDAPPRPPVSIFAHLLDPNGVLVAGADGLGVPAEVMRSGDTIAQSHSFSVPYDASEGSYAVEFGFYRLDTLERYSVSVAGKSIDQRVLTPPFKVTK